MGNSTPEQKAREEIDRLLSAAGWAVQDVTAANIHAARGVALREFPLNTGHGKADYLLYLDAKACGIVEAKKQGATLKGVELQSAKYSQGLPVELPAWGNRLFFVGIREEVVSLALKQDFGAIAEYKAEVGSVRKRIVCLVSETRFGGMRLPEAIRASAERAGPYRRFRLWSDL